MQKLFNLAKWRSLEEGEFVEFANPRPRNVRLEVNAAQETRLYISHAGDDDQTFLALIKGRDILEFASEGAFSIMADGGAVAFYTADGEDITVAPVDPLSYTRIVERRQRNPEIEHMMHMVQLNVEKRLAKQAADFELRLAAESRIARRDAAAAAAAAASAGADAGTANADGGASSDSGAQADASKSSDKATASDAGGKAPAVKSSPAKPS